LSKGCFLTSSGMAASAKMLWFAAPYKAAPRFA